MAEPAAHGVSLRAYARVTAALAEGFALSAALEHGGVDPRIWPDAERSLAGSLARAPLEDPALLEAFDARLIEARDDLARPIPPVDEDLGAWLDFLRTWAEREDPFARLAELGLTEADIFRLSRAWARRIEGDERLQEEAARVLGRPPREVEIPRPAPRVLPRAQARPPTPPSAVVVNLPRLAVPLPVLVEEGKEPEDGPRRGHELAETGLALDVPRGPALPFAAGNAPLAPPSAPAIAVNKPPPGLTGTAPAVDVPRGPALPFAAASAPPTPPSAPAIVVNKAPPGLTETSLALNIPRGPALPFAAARASAPGSAAVSSSPPGAPSAPAIAVNKPPPGLVETAPAVDVPRGPVLPFAPAAEAPPDAEPKKG